MIFAPALLQLIFLMHPRVGKKVKLLTAEGRKDEALELIRRSLHVSPAVALEILQALCHAFGIKLPEEVD